MEILTQNIYGQYAYYKSHPEVFCIMYDIGNVRAQTTNPKINEFLSLDLKITNSIKVIIENGQVDGSISNAKDALTTTLHFKFFLTAIFDKLIITGSNYAKHIGKSEDEFAKGLLELVIDTLRIH
ncbi:hypothetical protein [Fusibacter ferrireducens]|uniref:hypothetical protein n=1 Tax=Fusibacter ferrireducens TaxID=2785058 RepID=UPI001A9B36AB|nr:hypothetical protein [Fusibacter ferrireducens]